MKLKNLVGLIPLLYAASAVAIEPFVVKDIRVEGIQRTEAGTVFSYLPVKVGDKLDDDMQLRQSEHCSPLGFSRTCALRCNRAC